MAGGSSGSWSATSPARAPRPSPRSRPSAHSSSARSRGSRSWRTRPRWTQTVPPGIDYYWKSHFLVGLPDDAIDVIVDRHRRTPTTWSYSLIPQLGGAIARVPEAATAYANRAAPFAININGVGTEPGEHDRTVPWVREVFDALTPFSTGGVYVNFLGDEGEDRVRAAYGSAYDRLAAVKARYDPANVFRTNQNVPPARST